MKIDKAIIRTDRLNSERLINTLRERGTQLHCVTKSEKYLTFEVREDNVGKCIECLENKNIQYQVISKRDKSTVRKFAFGQLVLGFWTILYIFVTIFLCSFCYWVEVDAPSPMTQKAVEKIIVEQGLDRAFSKKKLDSKMLEKTILERINNVAFVDISMIGSKLNISVQEQHEEPVQPAEYDKIVASCDCIVERVLVSSGTAVVKAGERVRKGQVLIDGYIDLGNPEDPANVRQPVKASGVVYGRVWKSKRVSLPEDYVEAVPTGESTTRVGISIFGWEWKKQKQPDYEHYQTTSTSCVFGSFFPLKYTKTTYHEVKYAKSKVDERYIQSQIDNAQMDILADLEESAMPIRTWNFQKKLDKIYILDIYYEIEMPINVGG